MEHLEQCLRHGMCLIILIIIVEKACKSPKGQEKIHMRQWKTANRICQFLHRICFAHLLYSATIYWDQVCARHLLSAEDTEVGKMVQSLPLWSYSPAWMSIHTLSQWNLGVQHSAGSQEGDGNYSSLLSLQAGSSWTSLIHFPLRFQNQPLTNTVCAICWALF